MKVRDVMTTSTTTTTPDMSLKDAALGLAQNGISGMPVVDADERVVGVLSEADILVKEGDPHHASKGFLHWLLDPEDHWLASRFEAATVAEAMSAPPLTIGPDRPLVEAATRMVEDGVNRLPVVDEDGILVGIVSRGDLVRAFTRSDEEIRHEIVTEVFHHDLWVEDEGIVVSVANGVVTLSGTVRTKSDAELLPTFVRRVPGVVSVESALKTLEH